MTSQIFTALIVSLFYLSNASAQQRTSPLFDGRSLNDWEYDLQHWRIENGAIVGEIPEGENLRKNTWIIWRGGELKDFDFRVRVKLTGAAAANSGIQFRCQAKDAEHVSGYQADLDQGATWLGRIYDEHGRRLLVERGRRVKIDPDGQRTEQEFAPANQYAVLFRDNDWNDYRIVAIGPRVSVFVNGTLFSEMIDEETGQRDLSGSLAFQLHSGPHTRVEFRDVMLETLNADDSRLDDFEIKPPSEPRELTGVAPQTIDGKPLNLGFETGDLTDWTATGEAFEGQPVSQDGIPQRWPNQTSNKQGQYFIGGWEIKNDRAQGTLTSRPFRVTHPYASFLIAGGDSRQTRVELFRPTLGDTPETVIATASGNRREQMRRVSIDLREHQGQQVAVRLIDESSGAWGHLNFDDFRFHVTRPPFADEGRRSINNPLLHHLVPNPTGEKNKAHGRDGPPQSSPSQGEPGAQTNGSDTISKMHVPKGFSVDLIAAEPELHQPMAFTFDAKGRLWVVEGHSYPSKRPDGEGLDRILIFEDTDTNGSYEKRTVFIEGLNLVSGMQVGHGGVWVGAAPELLFIPDQDLDGTPDGKPEVLLDGFGFADTHETINSFSWGPDGWLYGNQGVFNESHVGKPGTRQKDRTHLAAGVWRYHPTRREFEVFAHGGSNPWGLDFDDVGQLFMTHCRSNWGRGSTTHVMQGAHYWNQINSGYAPFISPAPIAGIAQLRNYMLASSRYGHGEGGAGKRGSRAVYGGHSHVGTMIYLGDNWPTEYRNHLFTHNLHGHQINHQVNERLAGGYNTVHAGHDVFFCSDPQYVGVDLQYGPDGAVYISDWYDPRHCHSPHNEQWDRGNGRMYRMKFDSDFKPVKIDYWAASDETLAIAQQHPNEWHVRMARLVLAERAADREISAVAINRLLAMAAEHDDVAKQLRAIWCLHVIGEMSADQWSRLMNHENEHVRGWSVRLATEQLGGEKTSAMLIELARKETSLLVRRYLASAAQRVDSETAWALVETLASQAENATDRDLPLLIWYAIAPLVELDLDRAMALADRTAIPAIRHYVHWYAPQLSQSGREAMVSRIRSAEGNERITLLGLLSAGLSGTRGLKQPQAWQSFCDELYDSADLSARHAAESLGSAFGDEHLFVRMRAVLGDASASPETRGRALSLLVTDDSEEKLALLLEAIDTPTLFLPVTRQLKTYDDVRVAKVLIDRLPKLTGTENDAVMETLCSRVSWATELLDAIDQQRLEKERLTAFFARQMAGLGNAGLIDRLERSWGKLGQSSAEMKAAITQLANAYREAPKWAYNRNSGAATFQKLCANCHAPTSDADRIGPKLSGTGSKGIEYIVENMIDPNAVIGKDFQARNILTVDGLVVTGVILNETDSAMTVRTANATQIIAREDIQEIVVSPNSFMPEGLLKPLSEREKIELLMHLMSL